MNMCLAIITTVLVVTQIIRVTQNQISLFKQEKEIKKTCDWIKDNDVSERDFEIQRAVYYMLYNYLKSKDITPHVVNKRDKEQHKKCCGVCKWYEFEDISDGHVCCNAESEHLADWVEYEDICEFWEKKDE